MPKSKERVMTRSEVPVFVNEVIEAGCNICAVGHDSYVIGDIADQDRAKDEIDRITEKYGDREPLKWQIVAYLWSIGRYIELASEATRH